MSARTVPPASDSSGNPAKTDASGLPWEVFICRACGLLYDEGEGDEDSGLPPGTRFADIPDDWACPLCGVTKSDFEPYVAEAPTRQARRTTARRSASSRHDAGTVIIGAGRAGWQMAQALRERDTDMRITILTSCDGDVYDKPLLSVAMSRDIALEKLPRERGEEAAERLNVKLLAQTHAVRILPASRQVRTSRGTLRYRNLVLAHGAEARSLPQFPPALCWRINHLKTYAAFRSVLGTAPQRVAVIGAGLIGSELANDLALARHTVTLLDVATRPLAACLSENQSQQLLDAWKPLAIRFVGNAEVRHVQEKSIDGAPTLKQITTQAGEMFEVDHIILAAGLQTPNRLAMGAGLLWKNGIDVQAESLATSVAGIYALGDCISIGGQISRYIEPIGRQAQTLAASLLGEAAQPFVATRVPLRVKTTSLPFTV